MNDARIDLTDVRVRRGRRHVLDGCTAEVGPGITLLLGGNGAGKSTLLAAVAGLLPISSGTISVAGRPVGRSGLSRWQGRRVGYLPQEPRLPPQLTVAEAIDHGRWLRRASGAVDDADAERPEAFATDELAERLRLSSVLDRPVGELSGGMNRLAMLATAVVHRPAVLLLDEATAGVDVVHRAPFRSFLDDLRASTAVLLATHVSDDLAHLADRVLAVGEGRVTFSGDASTLAARGESDRRPGESAVEAALRLAAAPA